MPITPWTKSGTNAIVPTIAIADRPTEATPAATIGLRRNSNGRIGSFALRSTNTNAVTETSATANAPSTCVELHGCVSPPQTSPSRNELVADREQRRPEQVERVLATLRPLRDRDRDHGQRGRADGQVDVEHPAPGRVVDDQAAEGGADDRAGGERRADQALVAAAIARRDDDADRRDREGEEPAGARPLHGASRDELAHALREPAEHRAEQEDRDREDVEQPPPVDVAELPVQRDGDRHREHVGGDHPRVALEAAEVGDDRAAGRSRRSSGRAQRGAARP